MRKQFLFCLITLGSLATVGVLYAGIWPQHAQQNASSQSQYYLQETPHNSGAIAGQVFDAEGQPVSGVRVEAANINFTPTGMLPSAITDEKGKFLIKGLASGTYKLYTEKKEDDYPYSMYAFTNINPEYAPEATVSESQVASDVVIRLGPKSAKLVISILDAITGKPVKNARITLHRVDNPIYRYSTLTNTDKSESKGKIKILVPPVPFTIEVSSPNYEAWTYSKDGLNKRSDLLKVNPGEVKKLMVALHPKKQPKF